MAQFNFRGDNTQKAKEMIKKDTLLQNLLRRSPDEIIKWYGTANAKDKDDVLLRLLLTVQFLLKDQINNE